MPILASILLVSTLTQFQLQLSLLTFSSGVAFFRKTYFSLIQTCSVWLLDLQDRGRPVSNCECVLTCACVQSGPESYCPSPPWWRQRCPAPWTSGCRLLCDWQLPRSAIFPGTEKDTKKKEAAVRRRGLIRCAGTEINSWFKPTSHSRDLFWKEQRRWKMQIW